MLSKLSLVLSIAALTNAATNTNLQTVFPASSGTSNLAAAKTIAAGQTFDGGMKKWDRSPSTCNDQAEGGDADAVFVLQAGAVLSNAYIGKICKLLCSNTEGLMQCLQARITVKAFTALAPAPSTTCRSTMYKAAFSGIR